MKKLLTLLIALALPTLSYAQSSPGLVYGQVPTAGQWNSYFAAKQDLLTFPAVNKRGDTMLGPFGTVASTSTAAGFTLPPGTVPTSPVDGNMWMTASGVFARVNGSTVGPFGTAGAGAVSSVFTRTGAVVAASGDYTIAQVTNGLSNALTSSRLFVGNGSNVATGVVLSGDATLANTGAITVTKTSGTNFAASATTDTTSATNITSGTLAAARGGAGNVIGALKGDGSGNVAQAAYSDLSSGAPTATSGALGLVRPDNATITITAGVLSSAVGGGTVTHTAGALTASRLMIGAGGNDANILGSLGTTTTVLHGNAAGAPTFGSVNLTTDISSILPIANGGTGSSSQNFVDTTSNQATISGVKTFLTNIASTPSGSGYLSYPADFLSGGQPRKAYSIIDAGDSVGTSADEVNSFLGRLTLSNASIVGNRVGVQGMTLQTVATGQTTGNYVGVQGYGSTSSGDGGSSGNEKGAYFGGGFVAQIVGGTFINNTSGIEINTVIPPGSGTRTKIHNGLRIASFIGERGYGADAAISVSTLGTIGGVDAKWGTGILFGDPVAFVPFNSSSIVLRAYAAMSVDTVFDLRNFTATNGLLRGNNIRVNDGGIIYVSGGNQYGFQGGSQAGSSATATFSGVLPAGASPATNTWTKMMIDGSMFWVPIWPI